MTPGARVSAAIEILDMVNEGQPVEKALTNWARRSRFADPKIAPPFGTMSLMCSALWPVMPVWGVGAVDANL